MRTLLAFTVGLLLGIASMFAYSHAKAATFEGDPHWPGSGERVISVKYVNIEAQLVADAAAEWSRSPYVALNVVGPGDIASCQWDSNFERGVVTVCGDGSYGECCPMGWIGSFMLWDPDYHMLAASVHVVTYYGLDKMRHSLCHELGHTLGLNHPDAGSGNAGCMGGGTGDALAWERPDEQDFADLARIYSHGDGTSATATPTVAVTSTATATRTASPVPSCRLRGNSGKCK